MSWLTELGPTWYSAVPTIHQAILEQIHQQPGIANRVHLRFIRSCSSPVAPKVAQDLEKVFKAPVLEAYGMTEATHQIASNPLPPRAHKFGSVGCATGSTRIAQPHALARIEQEVPSLPEVLYLVQFVRTSERGITR